MSDTYVPSFFTTAKDDKGGVLTYEQLQARRQVAQALATRNRPYPKTIGEGLTALGEGLGEGWNLGRLQKAEGTSRAANEAARRSLESGGVVAPATPGQGAALDDPAALNALALANSNDIPADVTKAAPQAEMSVDEWLVRNARNETGAEPEPYRAIGQPNRRGDYPLGKYQIMGENVPEWSKLYLGKEITPQQFLADAKAQETIARGRASEYIAKYGPVGAAEAWFAGEDGRIQGRDGTRPNLGRHLDKYVAKFNEPLVDRSQVVASLANGPALAPGGDAPIKLASLGGVPTPDTAPAQDPRAIVTDAVVAQQQPQPVPQQVAQVAPQQQPVIQKAPAPEVKPTPAGPEPKLRDYIEGDPALKARMENAQRVMRDETLSPGLRASAAKHYEELERRANDAYSKQWTIWHERTKKEDEFKLGEETRQRARELAPHQLEKARKDAEPTTKEVDGRLLERDPQTQKWTDVTPGGHLPNLTVEQSKILGFYQRGKWAMHNLGDGKELTDFAAWHAAGMPVVGNYAVNAKFQRQLAAANEIAAVQLRLETGTAAPPAELKNVIDRYVPKPGDKPETHLQKEQSRTTLIKSYADMMGSKGAPYIDKFNREFELDRKEYDKKQNALLPPIKITDPELVDLLPPGRRWIAPDGKIKQK